MRHVAIRGGSLITAAATRRDGAVSRRALIAALAAFGAGTLVRSPARAADGVSVDVWKSPYCGCCGGWIDYMRAKGYRVNVTAVEDMDPVKIRFGVPADLTSCHTAKIGDYLIEGHVPEPAIAKLLAERPALRGLALPGMPEGSPGMDGPPGVYAVVGFDGAGRTSIFLRTGA
ncbi:MAG: DUF411 domain-containing protein [Methylobacteriaceae bacterium]|nr:DUF411 domain-containing protein [Rhodoblastus sp.]MCC0006382.1 DUF411 domain-containing protein [Methylobacteriaceae bacterium]